MRVLLAATAALVTFDVALAAAKLTPKEIQTHFFDGKAFTAATTSGTKFKMTLVPVSAADAVKVKASVTSVVLPLWKESCNKVDPKCSESWNATVGKARGYKIN